MKTEIIEVHPEFPDIGKIAYCGKVIRQGGLVVFPTETVYGVAADVGNPKAMARLREVKKRSFDKPFSILISQTGLISNYTSALNPALYKIIDAFWPGPLTVIVPTKDGKETIGIRMPDHIIALKLVQESQCTIAAPSANFEGNEPPTTLQMALRDMNGLIDVAIDGGTARIGKSSTVVDVTSDPIKVLREGAIIQSDISRVAGRKTILFVCTGNSCRSVMAEYLLKDQLKRAEHIRVISAGTSVFVRSTASAETIAVLKEKGIEANRHVSQPVTSILLKQADLIFVMTQGHRQQVLDRVPEVEKRVYLLKEFANIPANFQGDLDIPDPIGHSRHEYRECLNMISEAVNKIVELV